jgi:predicted dehydrogenase
MRNQNEIGLGVVGCGGFGLFALQHFMQVPDVKLVGIAATHAEAADYAARRFDSAKLRDISDLLSSPDLDLVYIATPPFLHYEVAMHALAEGKHVICEKPLAMNLHQADEMLGFARSKELMLVTNLMQRYNPMFERVKRLIDEKPLGDVLHGYFENYAADEGLHEQHWFWDPSKSAGIFIEHGVHFFDMFSGWMGAGKVEAAQAATRPGSGVEDQVQCTVRYGNAVLVNYYHGFTQPGRLDRQELRILFERGDITLHEWIPVRAKVRAVADEADTQRLMNIFPGARLDITTVFGGKDRKCRGRFKEIDLYHSIELTAGLECRKMHVYGDLLRALFQDQVAWLKDRSHSRKVTEDNGYASLAVAVEADRLAHS